MASLIAEYGGGTRLAPGNEIVIIGVFRLKIAGGFIMAPNLVRSQRLQS
jgi:hypothetical protein